MHSTLPLLPILLLTPLSSAEIPSSPPTLTIYKFGAFVSADPFIPSHIGFSVLDPRPLHHVDADCTFSTSETYPSIYMGGWWPCTNSENHEELVEFWIDQHFIKLRRPWVDYNAERNETIYLIGLTDKQYTLWSYGDECANATETTAGTYFTRTTDWDIPVTTILA